MTTDRQPQSLDAWLDSYEVEKADPAFVQRVTESASPYLPKLSSARESLMRWLWPAGFAGVGLAGSLAGALLVSVALRASPQRAIEGPERGTAFSAIPADWSEE